ncbi:uncharacterized protein CELE_H01M10.2 [Caenorhabditis elegans]|uniref:Secreted protein n=1 Tax=Caenorhabditis elegans TaxID=6239 RepID=Q9N5P4_CAEEL|nr:Secreted protein [Caenorhabditis elegans]CCD71665.1 Secreted protein [Caenorhabditis elegans]|eukprot:NP_508467.2 Uncharacterized protein CELE_H01M10.2 [Caenorhabditis elegans]
MKLYLTLFALKIVESCTPSFSAPLTPAVAPQPINIISNSPPLPPIAFQVDQPIPHSADYADEPVAVQKDSIIPFHNEKLKQRFSLFDMFRPLSQPATTAPLLIKEKPVDNIALNISFSPPVHWTFCFPSCGVNDQAVDEDDAYEKAKDDVLDAVQSSCVNEGAKCDIDSVDLQYHPESVLTEDFGSYYDLSGNRYKISGKTIPYKINNIHPGIINNFVLPMKITFKLSSPIPEATAKMLKQKIIDYLAARKFLHISSNSD